MLFRSGKEIRLYYNSQDLRTVRAFLADAAVTLVRLEDDSDFHLVLRDGSAQMIGGGTPSEAQSRATSAIVS